MAEETKQTQNNVKDEVLRKRLYELSAEEITAHFTKCHCLLRRRKFGKGNNAQVRYSATLQIKKDIYEIDVPLTLMEYNNIVARRKMDITTIPESLTISVFFFGVKSERVDEITGLNRISYQLKMVLSTDVRKKVWLTDLQASNAIMFKAIDFVDRPEWAEQDVDTLNGFADYE